MTKTTRDQRVAIHRVWQRNINGNPNPLTYREFRRTVIPGFGYVMVQWAGMWLGIEPDGYTHS